MKTKILDIKRLTIGYCKEKQEEIIFSDLDFHVCKGEMVSLLGPNGAGKSTLLRSISGVQPYFRGEILISGIPLSSLNHRKLSSLIGIVLTDRHFGGGLKVHEIVSMGRAPYTGFFGRLSSEDRDVVNYAIDKIGIYDMKDRFFADLSDGEKQKVMIAKALAQQSDLIILDEPTSFLDITSKIEIMNLLRELAVRENKTILLSTHDINQAISFSDKLLLIHKEYGLKFGSPETLILEGDINKYFSHNDISYNPSDGHFVKSRSYRHQINVVSEIKAKYALEQLFNRHYIGISNEKCPITVYLKSPNEIRITSNGIQSEFFTSIEELDNWLSSYFK